MRIGGGTAQCADGIESPEAEFQRHTQDNAVRI